MSETPLSRLGLIHGAGNLPVPVAADEVTPDWIRRTLADVRRIIESGMADRVRLLKADKAMVDEGDRECRSRKPCDLFAAEASVAPPNLPSAPSSLPGSTDPAAIPPELVPWLRRGRTATASLFATVSYQKGGGHWFVVVPMYVRESGEPSRFGAFRTEIEAVRAAVTRFGPTPPRRNQGKGKRVPIAPAEGATERGRKAAAREWMLERRRALGLQAIER